LAQGVKGVIQFNFQFSYMVKRAFDLFLALGLSAIFLVPILFIAVLVRFTSPGPALYWSQRYGKNNALFSMPKFRTMKIDAPEVATHLLENPASYLTSIGPFLRKTSLDELPQLWSILCGDMSFVGPRPALFNQIDLVELRTQCGVDSLTPGLTGWAQINGRDELPIAEKVALDKDYLKNQSLLLDIKILWLTLFAVLDQKGVSH
jgi:O-antigen biosynthesis protein WbqP